MTFEILLLKCNILVTTGTAHTTFGYDYYLLAIHFTVKPVISLTFGCLEVLHLYSCVHFFLIFVIF